MVELLHTSTFLNTFRRFLCLTGWKTKDLRSDCSTTFRGACNVLKQEEENLLKNLYHRSEVEAWMKNKSIVWDFSTPVSSHHQSLVERQIRFFREITEGVIGPGYQKHTPTDLESRLFGATISAPPISLLYVFCTDSFGANSVLFNSSLI